MIYYVYEKVIQVKVHYHIYTKFCWAQQIVHKCHQQKISVFIKTQSQQF